jgi:hypothetical protein
MLVASSCLVNAGCTACKIKFVAAIAANQSGERAADREREAFPHIQHGRQPDYFRSHDLAAGMGTVEG